MSRCRSRSNCPSAWSSLKFGGRQLEFRSSGEPSKSIWYISDIQRWILWAIYQSQLGKWVPATVSPPIFLNGYISAMTKRHIDLQIKSTTFRRYLSTMSGVPVLTRWRRHCLILPFKAGTIVTPHKFSTNYPLPINCEILAETISYTSSNVRKSHFSAPYHSRYFIWEKPMST